jgi:short subunit dehydrogenase-like uncharacterized protein
MSKAREFDVVVFGATGFVGRQAAAYLQRHAPAVRLALAGRNAQKLQGVQRECAASAQIIVADAQNSTALQALAARTRVVLSCAGPFALYGSALVAACVDADTHYVDITGETPWVRQMIDLHHARAAKAGTRIVPGCGFDSVPSDLGAYLAAQEMQRRFDEPCVSVKAAFSMRGGVNGGTLASALNMLHGEQKAAFAQPFLLNPEGSMPANVSAHADPIAPVRDADFSAWLGPFVMGPINTRVVRRSTALWRAAGDRAYGDDFHYQEYLRFGRGPLAAAAAAGMSAGALAAQSALTLAPLRSLAARLAPQPGEGPSEHSMNHGRFRCQLIGKSASGNTLRITIADQGDPGNRATTKMVCESALALVLNTDALPGGKKRGGVITPAFALGDVLVQRLRAAGMRIEIAGEPA